VSEPAKSLNVGVAGFGTIGAVVSHRLDQGVFGLRLVAIAARNIDKARLQVEQFSNPVPILDHSMLADMADVIVDCTPASVSREIAEQVLQAGRILVPLSIGVLLEHPELIDLAVQRGGRIIVPTGALLGLDAVRAAAEGRIHAVRIVTRKPPRGLEGAPYLVEKGIDITDLKEPIQVFSGNARDGIIGFPGNVNVAVALSLAGVGADRTELEIWIDPRLERNVHTVVVEADSARFTMNIENIPSVENPSTGRITALSVIAALRGLVSPMRAGS
tara:strand:- start:742 stop:1563 length:822 start_codon:yes stop_codon:yes gene_type:complete